MANNYTEASFEIANLTDEEIAWWEKEASRDMAVEDPEGKLTLGTFLAVIQMTGKSRNITAKSLCGFITMSRLM